MSKAHREKGLWPMSSYARYLWLVYGLWEDMLALNEAYKVAQDPEVQLVVVRHMLVDFDSLDELIKEFHGHVKRVEVGKLSDKDAELILGAFSDYHRVLEPHRSKLKQIRNNLGAHRTGMPWVKAKTSGTTDSNEWGKWEQLLVKLERHCDLSLWLDTFNAALTLIQVLKDFNLDAWYTWPEDDEVKFFMPIQPPGFYPREPHEY